MQKIQSALIFISLLHFMCKRVQPRDAILITDIQASTELKSGDFRYAAVNVFDGDAGRSWVEGKEGDGIHEYLKIQFAALSWIRKISIVNGFGDAQYWHRNNRVKELSIENENGPFKTITLADTREKQNFRLENFAAETLTLRIQSVYASGKDPDTAIAEIVLNGAQLGSVLAKKITDQPFYGLYVHRGAERPQEQHFLLLKPAGDCRALSIVPPMPGLTGIQEEGNCTFSVDGKSIYVQHGRFRSRFRASAEHLILQDEFLALRRETPVPQDSAQEPEADIQLRRILRDPVKGSTQIEEKLARQRRNTPDAPCSGVDDPPNRLCE